MSLAALASILYNKEGHYTVARRYGFYVRVARKIFGNIRLGNFLSLQKLV